MRDLKSSAKDRIRPLFERSRLFWLRERWHVRGRNNAVFVWIPKTAGTSLLWALGLRKYSSPRVVRYRFPGRGGVSFGHMDYARLINEGYVDPAFHHSAFRFAFCRDPYDRAVSLFYWTKYK